MERATRAMFARILATLSRSLRDDDLTVAEVAGLHLIDQHGSMAIGALAEELALSMSAASRLVVELVKRGWVARTESPDDRRVRLLNLTPAGATFVQRASDDRVATILATVDQIVPRSVSRLVFAAMGKYFNRG